VEPPQIGISSSSDPLDPPQDHLLPVGWIVPIWVLDLDLHMHAHDLPNLIQKSDLKSDLSGRMHHLNIWYKRKYKSFCMLFLRCMHGTFFKLTLLSMINLFVEGSINLYPFTPFRITHKDAFFSLRLQILPLF
jgi:hypothetical protein